MTKEQALAKLDRIGNSLAVVQASVGSLLEDCRDLRKVVAASQWGEGAAEPQGEQQTLDGK